MKKLINLIAWLAFWLSLIWIMGTAGAADLNYIPIRRTIINLIIGLVILGLDVIIINWLGRDVSEV